MVMMMTMVVMIMMMVIMTVEGELGLRLQLSQCCQDRIVSCVCYVILVSIATQLKCRLSTI